MAASAQTGFITGFSQADLLNGTFTANTVWSDKVIDNKTYWNPSIIQTGFIVAENITGETVQMNSLYKVYVVETDGEVVIEETTVAKTEEEAKFKAGVYGFLSSEGLTLDNITVLITRIGNVKIK